MGFLILIVFSIYGLGHMCQFPENRRQKNALDNRPISGGPFFHENPAPDSRAERAAADRPPVRPGTNSGGMRGRAAEEDDDDGEVSIDELEYMRHFFR